jgi:hypothetical protein
MGAPSFLLIFFGEGPLDYERSCPHTEKVPDGVVTCRTGLPQCPYAPATPCSSWHRRRSPPLARIASPLAEKSCAENNSAML